MSEKLPYALISTLSILFPIQLPPRASFLHAPLPSSHWFHPPHFFPSCSWPLAHSVDTLMNEVGPEAWNTIFCCSEFPYSLFSSTYLSFFHSLSLFHSDLATWLQRNPLPPVTCPGLFQWVARRQGLPGTPPGGNRGRCDRKTLQESCILA